MPRYALCPGRDRRRWIVTLCVVALFGVGLSGVSRAAPPKGDSAPRLDAPRLDAPRLDAHRLYMVQLDEPPAVEVAVRKRAAGVSESGVHGAVRQHLLHLQARRQDLLARLAGQGIEPVVVSRLSRVYNGMALFLTPSQAASAARLPGVMAVRVMVPKQRTNSTSVPFIGVPQVWQGGGPTGAGVRIGIIDSGIDYLHTDFAGSGLAADYGSNDTTIVGDGFFPTAKVVGGWDFVGDAYDASSSDPALRVPQPDPDPMDCNGHGTHVAGTAAGFGVQGDGSTYLGAYDATTPFADLAIGPGVAPQALLYALRVFGCSGETAVVEQALEWAVDPDGDGDFSDHLDVVNLSLTSPLAPLDDPAAVAAEHAVAVGVTVVASAGNDGGTHFAVGSPAVATGAIAVAASWDPDPIFPARAVRIEAPAELAGAHQAGGANFGPALVEPGITGDAVLADPLDACAPLQNDAAEIDGKVALVRRSDACSYVTQVRHAQQAGTTGAVAVVLINDRPGLEGVFNDGTGGDITIPPLLIRQVAGQRLLDALPGQVTVTLTPTVLEDMFAIFSSRGPRLGDLLTKPDLAAPGVAITSARLGDGVSGGSGAMILSGTSMASPHVAGAAALLRQQHPDWTPLQIKARLVNTGRDVFYDPELTPPRVGAAQMGAGRIDPSRAVLGSARLVSGDDEGAVGVTFGNLEVAETATDGTVTAERLVRLHNGPTAVTYDLTVEILSPVPGVEVEPGSTQISLGADQSVTVPLRLSLDAELLRHTHDPALDEATLGFARHWLTELAGLLVATPQSGADGPLRLPFYGAPRARAEMASATATLVLPPGLLGSTTLQLAGSDVQQGDDPPVDETSLVSVFELTASAEEAQGSPFPGVTALGLASDAASRPSVADSTVVFGVWAASEDGVAWSTPHQVLVSILIDTNRDGTADYELRNADRGAALSFLTDALVSVLTDLNGGGEVIGPPVNVLSPQGRHAAPWLSDVMSLAIDGAALGLSEGAGRFDYAVEVTQRRQGGSLARFGSAVSMPDEVRTYDIEAPGLSMISELGPSIFPDLDGATVPVDFDLAAMHANGGLGLLLLHHHNGRGHRGEIVTLRGDVADLALSVDGPAVVTPGRRWQVSWQIDNGGRQDAADVELNVQLPGGVTFEPEVSDPSCVDQGGGNVRCEVAALPAGSRRSVALGLRLSGQVDVGSDVEILGRVDTTSLEVALLNNHALSTVRASNVVLAFEKEIVGGNLLPGGSVQYRLRVANQGPGDWLDLSGPEIVDVAPQALQWIAATASAGDVEIDPSSHVLRWNGSLAAGDGPLTITATATIPTPGADGVVSNQGALFFDSSSQGEHDAELASDDPSEPGSADATEFIIGGIFRDGFESGSTAAWSGVVPIP